ncbi:GPW/gp25 family protein [Enterobacter bugandensis]|uniref:GPW/gp25 family protein n=1 Tax=Enterobacter bugandensis TaxID=881260 RepID=UPI002FD6EC7C
MSSTFNGVYGRGWAFPPQFTLNDGAVLVEDYEDIRQSLRILFNTLPAERVMHPWYGCDLHELVFENINSTLLSNIRALVRESIEQYEQRVVLNDVIAEADSSYPGLLRVQVSYYIHGMAEAQVITGMLDLADGRRGYFR